MAEFYLGKDVVLVLVQASRYQYHGLGIFMGFADRKKIIEGHQPDPSLQPYFSVM